jgi:hypothetical protein
MGKAFQQIDIKKEGNPHEGGYYYTNLGKIWYRGNGVWEAPLHESKGHLGFFSNPEWYFREGLTELEPPKRVTVKCTVCEHTGETRIGKNIPDWWYSIKCLDGRVQADFVEFPFCSHKCMSSVVDKIPETNKSTFIDPFGQLDLVNAVLLQRKADGGDSNLFHLPRRLR